MTPLAERFWQKVSKTDSCWLWMGSINDPRGYGRIMADPDGKKKKYAHRVSYELAHGPIPDGLDICHHCDNPRCVRPDHLFVGTRSDNMMDCVQKGRHKRAGGRKPWKHLKREPE